LAVARSIAVAALSRTRSRQFGLQPGRSARTCRDVICGCHRIHAVFIDRALIPIKYVTNGTTIEQVPVDNVIYYHLKLPQHDVVQAGGLPAESYLDIGDRFNFDNGGELISLRPILFASAWEAMGCAPLIVIGSKLDAARRQVAARAVSLKRPEAVGNFVA
jgi:hypothetical protein